MLAKLAALRNTLQPAAQLGGAHALRTPQTNTEICEQRFRHVNRSDPMLRHMGQERFNWVLLNIVKADHKFRAQELLRRRRA